MTPKRWRRLASRIVRPASEAPPVDPHLLHVQIEVVGAGGQLHEVDDRRPERRLRQLEAADLIRRQDAVRARPHQLRLGVLGLGAADDEEIRPQQARGEDGVDVLGVGADRRDQAARALDADALQHLFAARVGLDGEVAELDRLAACARDRAR